MCLSSPVTVCIMCLSSPAVVYLMCNSSPATVYLMCNSSPATVYMICNSSPAAVSLMCLSNSGSCCRAALMPLAWHARHSHGSPTHHALGGTSCVPTVGGTQPAWLQHPHPPHSNTAPTKSPPAHTIQPQLIFSATTSIFATILHYCNCLTAIVKTCSTSYVSRQLLYLTLLFLLENTCSN